MEHIQPTAADDVPHCQHQRRRWRRRRWNGGGAMRTVAQTANETAQKEGPNNWGENFETVCCEVTD